MAGDLSQRASFAAHSAGYRVQKILNAAEIPPRQAQRDAPWPIPVHVRAVWEQDGQEIVDGEAIAWTSRDALVQIRDSRSLFVAVWFHPCDLRRRDLFTLKQVSVPRSRDSGDVRDAFE